MSEHPDALRRIEARGPAARLTVSPGDAKTPSLGLGGAHLAPTPPVDSSARSTGRAATRTGSRRAHALTHTRLQ